MKILIVDDSYEVREVLRSFIEKLGHEIIEAVDGQDGFEKAKIHKPDLIITDAMMPKVDGFTLLRNIKMDTNLSSIPCVFYSAIYTGSKDRELALSLGAEAFIEKPKTLDELWEMIQTILERKKQPAAQIEKRMFKALFESNPDGIVIVNREGHIVQINKQGETMFGYTRDELLNQTIEILVPERFRERHVKHRNGYFAEPRVRAMGACFGLSARRKDGSEFSVDIMLSPLYTDEEMCVICVVRDVTEHVQMEKAMRKNEASLANAQRIAHLGNWEWNIVTNELWWSEEIYRIFGLTPQEFGATYDAFLNSVHPDDREFVKKSVNDALYEKMPYSIDHRIVLPDGSERIVHEQAEVIFDSAGKAIQMNGTVQNATERKRAEEEIKRLFTAIDQSINVVFTTDVKGQIEYVNFMFEQATGYAKEEIIGQNPRILASGETTHAEYEELWDTILAGKTWRGIFKNKKKDGQYYWCNGLITPIRNEKGQITHFLAIQEDITEKIKTEERAKHIASYDQLTGILNRTCFMEQLDEWLSHNKAYNQTGVLLLMDIDGFRLINDTYGHSTGDNALRHMAEFLITTLFVIGKHYVNKDVVESILGRLGGDEFAIFLPDRNEKEGIATAEEISKRLEKSDLWKYPVI